MADASAFHRMAERVGAVEEEEFAGAVVIVPPGGGEPVEFLITDPRPDVVQFFALVKSRVEIAYATIVGQAETQGGGNWR